MTALQVLAKTIERGVFLYIDNEQLKYRGSPGAVSDELKRQLQRHRDEIVRHLKRLQTGEWLQLPPIHKRPTGSRVPLSHAQQRLWFIHQLEGSAHYQVASAQQLTGPLDIEALKRALVALVERHEALRTVIVEEEGIPYQVVRDRWELDVTRTDLTTLDEVDQRAEIQRLTELAASQPFDLSRDLMIRVQVIVRSSTVHVVLLSLHHIATDAWSQQILQRELVALYTAFREGHATPLPAVQLQYGDYAVWQRNWLRGEVLSAQLDFWTQALKGIPAVHSLPLDRERPPVPSHRGDDVVCVLDKEQLERIRAFCKQHDVTLFVFLHTAVSVLLARYSGESDIVMGVPVAGRVHAALESIVGLFVNTIVLRVRVDGDPTFGQLLARNKQHVLAALTHQHVPFEMVVEALRPRRSPSYNPVFQVLFNMPPGGPRRWSLGDVNVEPIGGSGTSKFDLTISIIETAGELRIGLGYSTELFLVETIERMSVNLRVLLESILADPDRQVGRWLPDGILQVIGRVADRGTIAGSLPVPDAVSPRAPSPSLATETERRMEQLWRAVLGRDAAVDAMDDFFALGGHSLSMIVLIKRIAREFGVEIPLATFMQSPTIHSTVRLVEQAGRGEDSGADETGVATSTGGAGHAERTIVPLSEAERQRPLPLSTVQARVLAVTRLETGRSAYNIPASFRLTGPLCRESLRRAFETIVQRHAILRTLYRQDGEQFFQVVQPPGAFTLPVVDLTRLPADEQAGAVRERVRADSMQPFDLTAESSLRVQLLELSDEEHVVLLNLHHIAADAVAFRVLNTELSSLYQAYREGTTPVLPELPIQYCDYAVWEGEAIARGYFDEDLRYWKARLSGMPPCYPFALDRARQSTRSYAGDHCSVTLSGDIARQLEALARSCNATMFMAIYAALAVFIHRCSGATDVAIATALANRVRPEVERLIGCFINTVVLRSDLSDNPRFTDFLGRTRDDHLQAFAHQGLPYVVVHKVLNPDPARARMSPCQVTLVVDTLPGVPLGLPGLQLARAEGAEHPISKNDLMVTVAPSPERLTIWWTYATDIFERSTVASLASGFASLLEAIVREPDGYVQDVPFMSELAGQAST